MLRSFGIFAPEVALPLRPIGNASPSIWTRPNGDTTPTLHRAIESQSSSATNAKTKACSHPIVSSLKRQIEGGDNQRATQTDVVKKARLALGAPACQVIRHGAFVQSTKPIGNALQTDSYRPVASDFIGCGTATMLLVLPAIDRPTITQLRANASSNWLESHHLRGIRRPHPQRIKFHISRTTNGRKVFLTGPYLADVMQGLMQSSDLEYQSTALSADGFRDIIAGCTNNDGTKSSAFVDEKHGDITEFLLQVLSRIEAETDYLRTTVVKASDPHDGLIEDSQSLLSNSGDSSRSPDADGSTRSTQSMQCTEIVVTWVSQEMAARQRGPLAKVLQVWRGNTTFCSNCGSVHQQVELFSDYMLTVHPPEDKMSCRLHDLMIWEASSLPRDFRCVSCGTTGSTTIDKHFIRSPSYLIINVDRSSSNAERKGSKITTEVDIGVGEDLELTGHRYQIVSLVKQLDDESNDHDRYIVCRKEGNQWLLYADEGGAANEAPHAYVCQDGVGGRYTMIMLAKVD